jgi:hypothetical protein
MKLRIAQKIAKNSADLKYTPKQVRRAESVLRKYAKNAQAE